ncbi:MAG: ATPase [Breznakibacter sp.]
MVLIADSGSTKTEWTLINDRNETETFITPGINPFYQNPQEISDILLKEHFNDHPTSVKAIYFYGAGCANEEKCNLVKEGLASAIHSEYIEIGSDLLAAAHALCQDQPGIACILGTGSNSCYYDGAKIAQNVSPLGFILGDEGSGAVIGKQLIADILKKQLPQHIIELFFETYQVTQAELLDRVYKQPFPNRYLAQYTKFISKNINVPELEQLVVNGFNGFITRNINQYAQARTHQIHFTGSLAHHFRTQLAKALKQQGLLLGKIEQAPMQNLIKYHLQNI